MVEIMYRQFYDRKTITAYVNTTNGHLIPYM